LSGPSQIVSYFVEDGTEVFFETAPLGGFAPASSDRPGAQIREALRPAIKAAHIVIGQARELTPDDIELRFGVKVTGSANWLIAKTVVEGNFELILRWQQRDSDPSSPPTNSDADR
jgi:hypothetical protein